MISGGSAGGYTTLCALTPKDDKVFSGGASYYGVSDLEALARDTHKFESRYLDWLIGPYPRTGRPMSNAPPSTMSIAFRRRSSSSRERRIASFPQTRPNSWSRR